MHSWPSSPSFPSLPVTAIALSLTRFLMSPARYFSRGGNIPKAGKKVFLRVKYVALADLMEEMPGNSNQAKHLLSPLKCHTHQ